MIMTFRYLLQMIENDPHPSLLDICAGVRVPSTSNTDLGSIFAFLLILMSFMDVSYDPVFRSNHSIVDLQKNVLLYLYRLAQIVSYISYRINRSVAALPKKVWLWVKFTSMLYLVAVFRMVEISCSVLKYTFLDALASLEPILFTQSVSHSFFLDCR